MSPVPPGSTWRSTPEFPASRPVPAEGSGSREQLQHLACIRSPERDEQRVSRRSLQAASAAAAGSPFAVPGMEAEEAEDAQVVLGDAGGGVADEADAAGFQVRLPAEIVVQPAIGDWRSWR